MKPFLITGMGRSGTKFLAQALDRHTDAKVVHEVAGDSVEKWDPLSASEVMKRFVGHDHGYGEVNSHLRKVARVFPQHGIDVYLLIRDPRDVLRSVHNARDRSRGQWQETLDEIVSGIQDVLELHELPISTIRFERMITYYGFSEVVKLIYGNGCNNWDKTFPDKEVGRILAIRPVNESKPPMNMPHWRDWTWDEKTRFNSKYMPYREGMDRFGYYW